MYNPLLTLPLHLVCQLVTPGNPGYGPVENTCVPDHTTVIPPGYTPYPEFGVAWKFYRNAVTWNTARKLCLADGASLAIVDSYKKVDLQMEIKDKSQGVWTGLHKLFDANEWTNIKTGEPAGFIPWRPDAASSSGSCIANRHDTLGVSAWPCNNHVPVICEIPIFKSNGSAIYISQTPPSSTVYDRINIT